MVKTVCCKDEGSILTPFMGKLPVGEKEVGL